MKKTNATAIADQIYGEAYSANRYGVTEWRKAAEMLAERGLDDAEISWVLCSKWTRWAADASNAVYGHATAAMLMVWIDDRRNRATLAKHRLFRTDGWYPADAEMAAKGGR
jgi:hypothetical protein